MIRCDKRKCENKLVVSWLCCWSCGHSNECENRCDNEPSECGYSETILACIHQMDFWKEECPKCNGNKDCRVSPTIPNKQRSVV